MHRYTAEVKWRNHGPDFLNNEYSRGHKWLFDGGYVVDASAAPGIVPAPWSLAENVDPEEAFIASLASCHMLFFLNIASNQGFLLESYTDNAEGFMGKDSKGRIAITKIVLHPMHEFSHDNCPDQDTIDRMHLSAHQQCFIANSVKTKIVIK